ncbi:FAD-binding domain-containing protein [Colletotrichum truncatum]|uniref:FAD-binding domain-containing protein n=1 Tax=Colletotrichum truncatum TaxID=5467 RepID=A0ACC3ZL32_COLTU|nr:FAD-binding domain-containing protein [Colletotrichum truncatum]KAF6786938.1 FAD-binding domain-containing protein [Colletotrichum truncatum]
MHSVSILAAAFGLLSAPALASPVEARDILADLQVQAMDTLKENDSSVVNKRSACNIFNARYRRDWEAFSKQERKDYISAVQCMLTSPSKSDPAFAPGARNRYDDFVAVHINQTLSIHGTGNFLTWHRYFVWAYEEALRNECGYKGAQPQTLLHPSDIDQQYWNWLKYQDDLTKSPVFDGSETSLSGDGAFVKHNGSVSGAGAIILPSGNGGGCVESGPFVNMTVNLGPVSPGMDGMKASPNGKLGHNPRCLSRDLSSYAMKSWMTNENMFNLTVGSASRNIELFQNELQGRFTDGFLGMHAAGHFSVNGEASDLYSSVVDPTFFLHHAMVDRVYWLWQLTHFWAAFDIAGTITINNRPPSRDATVDDEINLGVTAENRKIGDLLNTLGNSPLCYVYA